MAFILSVVGKAGSVVGLGPEQRATLKSSGGHSTCCSNKLQCTINQFCTLQCQMSNVGVKPDKPAAGTHAASYLAEALVQLTSRRSCASHVLGRCLSLTWPVIMGSAMPLQQPFVQTLSTSLNRRHTPRLHRSMNLSFGLALSFVLIVCRGLTLN